MYKRAAVLGGGVAGIQAALDLAEMGIETYLVESSPSIGGRMAQLDKTFPTNDCAMCILSPKLVEAGSHPYVTIISNAEVLGIEGEAPNLKLKILKKARFVDEKKCTGCGVCMSKCPTKVPDPYNKNLGTTKCIRIPFPQAVPAVPFIDRDYCIYFRTGKCRICEKVCQAHAVDFEQKDTIIECDVGAVVIAAGSQEFDARIKPEYGYKVFPNVLTSIEFERILGASGPTGGHVVRPSDKKEPKRIGIIQCVGSRDIKAGNEHCSAICCMQACKDAIIAQEHLPDVQSTIFYMDVRAYGKNFDRFVESAKGPHKTRFICSRVSSVDINPENDNLLVHYILQDGKARQEEFDLIVLSVGLEPSSLSREAAVRLGAKLDKSGFLDTAAFRPVSTSNPAVFACGSISGPKDIPESVIEASGAAAAAAALVGGLPRKEIKFDYPAERDIVGEPPRVGVFVCRCGINIASVVDVPGVVAYAATLPRVKHAQELLFACAQDSQKAIKEAIEEKGLNRVVVCACTPRTHEPLFQKTLRNSGLNPFLFEFCNIREQCSWVHQKEQARATEKAKDLTRNGVMRVLPAQPLYRKTLSVNKDALVIGGGLAGMTAALDLASQGFLVHLVEKEADLGGNLKHIYHTLGGDDVQANLESLIREIVASEKIKVHQNAKIKDISGYIGNFTTTLETSGEELQLTHGIVIVAAGGAEHQPSEYHFGEDERIVTQRRFERMLNDSKKQNTKLETRKLKTVVMIQCVGSRNDERPFCSRVCCTNAIKNAISLKKQNPKASIYVLFRDIRTYGLREKYYRTARELGVIFIRYEDDEKPVVTKKDGKLFVEVKERMLGKTLRLNPDLVVLSTGVAPNPENKLLSQFLKVPLDTDGFFLEAHVKLRPVDFATDGVFVCGLSHYPKDIGETIAQARAAAGRAATVLCKDSIEAEGKVACVTTSRCSGCGSCAEVCAYKAIEVDPVERVAVVNEALCKGCGTCSATCRSAAITIRGFSDEQILAAIEAL